jgi:hypothetical protein
VNLNLTQNRSLVPGHPGTGQNLVSAETLSVKRSPKKESNGLTNDDSVLWLNVQQGLLDHDPPIVATAFSRSSKKRHQEPLLGHFPIQTSYPVNKPATTMISSIFDMNRISCYASFNYR